MPINRYSKHCKTTLEIPVDIEITPKDIENWIESCNYDEDLPVLKKTTGTNQMAYMGFRTS